MSLTVGSLFSGIGGLDLGLERAGMTVKWQCEIDDYCSRVLRERWPGVPNLGNVVSVPWASIERPDVLCGGYPCQPFSVTGGRLGTADARHLWPYFRDAIRVLRPRYALLENVPGHLSLGFGDVLADLADLGYDAEWDCIPASAFGAPHIRYRLFVVAYPAGQRLERRIFEQDGPQSFAARSGEDVADPEGECVGTGLREDDALAGDGSESSDSRRDANPWAVEPDVGRVAARVPIGLDGGVDAHAECIEEASAKGVPQTERLRVLRDHLQSSAASSEPTRCHLCGHPLLGLPCRGACAPWRLGAGAQKAEDVRCMREGVLGLLTRQGKDVQPFLSLGTGATQCTQAVGSRTDRLRGLGNAVVPQVAEWIGRRIVEAA